MYLSQPMIAITYAYFENCNKLYLYASAERNNLPRPSFRHAF